MNQRDEQELRAARFAMRMSLAIGVLMLLGKSAAYYVTGSAAILSDFAESVVHGEAHRLATLLEERLALS